jgi:hypothetical protein
MMNSSSFALKALGTMDPYDICVKQIAVSADLYWSIIWYYGSVYAALKDIGTLFGQTSVVCGLYLVKRKLF